MVYFGTIFLIIIERKNIRLNMIQKQFPFNRLKCKYGYYEYKFYTVLENWLKVSTNCVLLR